MIPRPFEHGAVLAAVKDAFGAARAVLRILDRDCARRSTNGAAGTKKRRSAEPRN